VGVVWGGCGCVCSADFVVTVVSDCCYDMDPEVHSVLCNKVFARQGMTQDVLHPARLSLCDLPASVVMCGIACEQRWW
jgi:hypothetical protein